MFGGVGPLELIVFGTIALLLFGKRLPEVARSLGKGIVEFKKGIRGIEDEVNSATYRSSTTPRRPQPVDDEPQELTAPKFEPPTSEPVSNTHE
jgi:sec-independent protein translocase protein TatA